MLIIKSQNITATVASCIYTFSLVFLFGTNSLYHRVNWEAEKRKWMKSLNHSAIYILIAGTFSPICLMALLGVFQSLFYVQAPKWLSATLYVIAGYLILPFVAELKNSIGVINLAWPFSATTKSFSFWSSSAPFAISSSFTVLFNHELKSDGQ